MTYTIKALQAIQPIPSQGRWIGVQPMVISPVSSAYIAALADALEHLAAQDGVTFGRATRWAVVETWNPPLPEDES